MVRFGSMMSGVTIQEQIAGQSLTASVSFLLHVKDMLRHS